MSKLHASRCLMRSLNGPELAELIGVLRRDCEENGISGELLGVCLEEAVARLKTQDGTTHDNALTPSAETHEKTEITEITEP